MNIEAIVISPHIDDAIISIGHTLNQRYDKITILNIFNLSQEIINQTIPRSVSQYRKEEDQIISKNYGYHFRYANLPDTSLRNIPWNNPSIPIDMGILNASDKWVWKQLQSFNGDYDLFIPASFNLHPDHYLSTVLFSREHYQSFLKNHNFFIYADLPYFFQKYPRSPQHNGIALLTNEIKTRINISQELKRKMLTAYSSQISIQRMDFLTISHPYETIWKPNELFFIHSQTRCYE